jgi:putative ABC transport system ATP-binding protein
MLTGPQLILADEPTGNLDPANKSKVLNVLFEQSTARNQTLVVVTHDHSVLSDFDRVIDFETFLQPVETTSEATA